ncbi:hypothetical protein RHMOL_Rhmol01G0105500 [Rhododendron molle]|uniref:Uncharacterized protein n=1 Tax=Rhododendron molle TaxID=49168 RepID=A0ACC0Q1J0_RHOML|nr:hypothetical protein RHMOL_Rhmol01G0105500 [Rhododendron molle]
MCLTVIYYGITKKIGAPAISNSWVRHLPHVYVIGCSGTQGVDYLLKHRKSGGVDVTLHPEELEAMDDALPAKYYEEVREAEEEKLRSLREDFSEMVAEYEKNRNKKIQEKQGKLKRNV